MTPKQILTVATEVGYMMLKHGGEVYRAEQSAKYICQHYGIADADIFAIPTSIVVTISDDDDFITKTRRITSNEVDLEKVVALNALSRNICATKPEYAEIMAQLREIDKIQPYHEYIRIFATGIISLSFAMLFGATATEGILAYFIGLVAALSLILTHNLNTNSFLRTTFCSFIITLMAYTVAYLSDFSISPDPIVAGALMVLVPGLAITNCMRDFMANDFMAGVSKLAEAMTTALATALGVSIVLILSAQLFGGF